MSDVFKTDKNGVNEGYTYYQRGYTVLIHEAVA